MDISDQLSHFSFPTNIHYGIGSRKGIVETLQKKSLCKPLIVTDEEIAKLPMIAEITNLLKTSGLQPKIFSEISGNPIKSFVTAGVKAFKSADADAIIAIGGGAAIDVAKVIALMAFHPGDLFDYEDGNPKSKPVDKDVPIILALPTTAGTGSEVGRSSVISDNHSKIKKIIFSPRILPEEVYIDPELTLTLPAPITATTGMDALSHLVEAYLAIGFNPMCDGIALQGIGLVAKNLEDCYTFAKNPETDREKHLEARGMMMNASYMGAVAFQKGLGVTHSCAHALSTVCNMHHGLANGIMINFCMEYNYEDAVIRNKFENLAQAAGLDSIKDKAFLQWLVQLKKNLNIPTTLKDAGVKDAQLNALVEIAIQDVCHHFNPRPVTENDMKNIFSKAFKS